MNGNVITLDQMCKQWKMMGPPAYVNSRFTFQSFQFAAKAGQISRDYFENSFARGGFDGKKWPARQSKWGQKFTHPLMLDTETLKNSIKMEAIEIDRRTKKGGIAKIWTNEESKAIRGKRGKSASYAAVHNTDPRLSTYTVNQHSSKKPEHRQFIGFADEVEREIEKHIDMIFDGLPL